MRLLWWAILWRKTGDMGSEWPVAAFYRSDGNPLHPERKRALLGLPDADHGRVEERICRVYGDPSFEQGAWKRKGLRSQVGVTRVRHDKKSRSIEHENPGVHPFLLTL